MLKVKKIFRSYTARSESALSILKVSKVYCLCFCVYCLSKMLLHVIRFYADSGRYIETVDSKAINMIANMWKGEIYEFCLRMKLFGLNE